MSTRPAIREIIDNGFEYIYSAIMLKILVKGQWYYCFPFVYKYEEASGTSLSREYSINIPIATLSDVSGAQFTSVMYSDEYTPGDILLCFGAWVDEYTFKNFKCTGGSISISKKSPLSIGRRENKYDFMPVSAPKYMTSSPKLGFDVIDYTQLDNAMAFKAKYGITNENTCEMPRGIEEAYKLLSDLIFSKSKIKKIEDDENVEYSELETMMFIQSLKNYCNNLSFEIKEYDYKVVNKTEEEINIVDNTEDSKDYAEHGVSTRMRDIFKSMSKLYLYDSLNNVLIKTGLPVCNSALEKSVSKVMAFSLYDYIDKKLSLIAQKYLSLNLEATLSLLRKNKRPVRYGQVSSKTHEFQTTERFILNDDTKYHKVI